MEMNIISFNDLNKKIEALSKNADFNNSEYSVLILVFGGQTKSLFKVLSKDNTSVNVLWYGWFSKNILSYVFYLFAAGFGSLVEIKDRKELLSIYETITGMTFHSLLYVPKKYISQIKEMASQKENISKYIDFIKNINDGFGLFIDSDVLIDDKAYIETIIGEDVPNYIKEVLK
jgi:hypothetical protein